MKLTIEHQRQSAVEQDNNQQLLPSHPAASQEIVCLIKIYILFPKPSSLLYIHQNVILL